MRKAIVRRFTKNGCHEVISHASNSSGYPLMWINGGTKAIHRYVFEKVYGPIPKGICVCHSCDNKRCINPEHLFLGTIADNMNDRNMKNRQAKGEKHGRAKLKNEDVIQIKKLLKEKRHTQDIIAFHFNISQQRVSKIKEGVTA